MSKSTQKRERHGLYIRLDSEQWEMLDRKVEELSKSVGVKFDRETTARLIFVRALTGK